MHAHSGMDGQIWLEADVSPVEDGPVVKAVCFCILDVYSCKVEDTSRRKGEPPLARCQLESLAVYLGESQNGRELLERFCLRFFYFFAL